MNKDELKEYNNEIRRMLQHEDNIRNQRTSWFLVLQGLLINGILLVLTNKDFDSKPDAIAILLFIGTIISLSFLHAAILSNKAYTRGKKYWQDIIKKNPETNNYPPVSLLEEKKSSEESEDKTESKNQESQDEIKLKNIFLPYFFIPLFFAFGEEIMLIYMCPYSYILYIILFIAFIFCGCKRLQINMYIRIKSNK